MTSGNITAADTAGRQNAEIEKLAGISRSALIWQQPDEAAPEAPSFDFYEGVVFVPVAADGSHFHPGLARGGRYSIGAKGEEMQRDSFDEALAELCKMAVPRWRRPNEVGNWGIVSGRDWKRIERRHLKSV